MSEVQPERADLRQPNPEVALIAPGPGEQVVLPVAPGTVLAVGFDPAAAKVLVQGGDLVLDFANGGVLVLQGFIVDAGAAAPVLRLPDGATVAGGALLQHLAGLDGPLDLETAAGPAAASGGGSTYGDDLGGVIGGLPAQNVLDYTELRFPEPAAGERIVGAADGDLSSAVGGFTPIDGTDGGSGGGTEYGGDGDDETDGGEGGGPGSQDEFLPPVASAEDGTVHATATDVSVEHEPDASLSVGDYLLVSNVPGHAIDPDLINGVDPANLTLSSNAEVTVSFVRESAGYHNMVGCYTYDQDGNIDPASITFIWTDATAVQENVNGASLLAKDFLNNNQPETVSLGELPAGTRLGFFLIADGASKGDNKEVLREAAGFGGDDFKTESGTKDDYQSDLDAINATTGFHVNGSGNGVITVNGHALQGNVYFTHDKALNTDKPAGQDIEHSLSGAADPADGKLYVGFEDLAGGGDKDYNDVTFAVDIGSYNLNALIGANFDPQLGAVDPDSANLVEAVITTTGFAAGDVLNLPSLPGFTVVESVDASNNYTVIVSGNQPLADWNAFLDGVFFTSAADAVEGTRTIALQVTDDQGLVSTPAVSTFQVLVDHTLSTSELSGATTLGGGDDVVQLSDHDFSPIDLGDGDDTVQIGLTDMGFGAADAAKLANVEALSLAGFGANAVTLSPDDVLTMVEPGEPLFITGDAIDSVTLTGDGPGGQAWVAAAGSDPGTTAYTWSADPSIQVIIDNTVQQSAETA